MTITSLTRFRFGVNFVVSGAENNLTLNKSYNTQYKLISRDIHARPHFREREAKSQPLSIRR